MSYVFIGGIPASGKSYLAKKISQKTGAFHLNLDTLRKEMSKDPKLEPWVNFFWNLDEEEYYKNTSCEDQWENLVKQSEAFWPIFLQKVEEIKKFYKSAIIEGVNILPHLAKKDINFPGIFLSGGSVEVIFERNKKNPRWGKTENLQRIEAENFYFCDGKMYKQEAEKYGYKTFDDSESAEEELLNLLKSPTGIDLVKQGYNKAAENYSQQRDQFQNNKYLEKLIELLKPGATVLDIGCGAGVPIDRVLTDKGFRVIGIDISEKQIELAKRNTPKASFEVRDMSELKEGEYQVDAVISFYAIFHTPRETHQKLFDKINSFLPQGGLILITMGAGEYEGVEDNFHGVEMFWSHYGAEKNTEIVENAGFKILLDEIDTGGDEKHQIIIAQKT